MHRVRLAAAAGAMLALVAAGCGSGAAGSDAGAGGEDPDEATRESATARLCELWEDARAAGDADSAEAALEAAEEYLASLPTALRQPARGDARIQCGSAEREAKQFIHSERSAG